MAAKKKFNVIGFTKAEANITNYEQVRKLIQKIKPQIIINTAAYQIVDKCEQNPDIAFAINTIAIKNIAEICQEQHIQTITISTDYVFDGKKGATYEETDIPHPLQIYGISKYAGELICLQYNPNSYIIRTCALFGGETGSKSKGNFIINILKEAQGLSTLEVNNDQIINPTYAVDLAEGIFRLIEKQAPVGIYHLVSSNYCSWADLAKKVMEIKKQTTKIIPVKREGKYGNLSRPLFTALENTKAKKLGITLPTWESAVERYIDSYLK